MDKDYMLIKCRKCGENTPLANYCKFCGAPIEKTFAKLEVVWCDNCKRVVAKGAYCCVCGKLLKI